MVIVATFERPEQPLQELGRRGVSGERILTLRSPLPSRPERAMRRVSDLATIPPAARPLPGPVLAGGGAAGRAELREHGAGGAPPRAPGAAAGPRAAADGAPNRGPITFGALSLQNLGAAFLQWIGIAPGEDRFRAIVLLCRGLRRRGVSQGVDGFRELSPRPLDPRARRRRDADGPPAASARSLHALLHRAADGRAGLPAQHGHDRRRRRPRDHRGHRAERARAHRRSTAISWCGPAPTRGRRRGGGAPALRRSRVSCGGRSEGSPPISSPPSPTSPRASRRPSRASASSSRSAPSDSSCSRVRRAARRGAPGQRQVRRLQAHRGAGPGGGELRHRGEHPAAGGVGAARGAHLGGGVLPVPVRGTRGDGPDRAARGRVHAAADDPRRLGAPRRAVRAAARGGGRATRDRRLRRPDRGGRRLVRLRGRARARRRELRDQDRRVRGARRAERRRQVDPRRPAPSSLRSRRRAHHHRRARYPHARRTAGSTSSSSRRRRLLGVSDRSNDPVRKRHRGQLGDALGLHPRPAEAVVRVPILDSAADVLGQPAMRQARLEAHEAGIAAAVAQEQ